MCSARLQVAIVRPLILPTYWISPEALHLDMASLGWSLEAVCRGAVGLPGARILLGGVLKRVNLVIFFFQALQALGVSIQDTKRKTKKNAFDP